MVAKITRRKFHRWVGISCALYALMAVISGVTHIVMTWSFPAPPPVTPTGTVPLKQAVLPLSALAERLPPGTEARGVNLRQVDGILWYQIVGGPNEPPLYLNAATGEIGDEVDKNYARQIAAEFLKTDALEQTDYITSFNNEYLNIYRVLPAYRFDQMESNGVRVYVSTITGSVTLYLNTPRAFSQKLFSVLHKFSFIPHKGVRDAMLMLAALSVLVTTIMGIVVFLGLPKKAR